MTRHRFLWVSLQIESLCDSKRIKIVGDLFDELARLPRTLNGMYSLILENIGQIEQRGRTVAETVFRWLLCTDDASSRVTIAACSGTISIECRSLSVQDILDVCSNLVDKVLDDFRFAHLSVREFLETQPGYTPPEANLCFLEMSLQTLSNAKPSGDLFSSYATFGWMTHYDKFEKQYRKEVFELHVKRFLFNGTESSDAFIAWATEAVRPTHSMDRPVRNYIQSYHWDFRSPVHLASRFGWLEILDYLEMIQSPNDFHGSAMTMMMVAICSGQTSVVRWLVDRNIYPTDDHLKRAFGLKQHQIIQTFLDKNIIPLNMTTMTIAIRFNLASMVRWLVDRNICPTDELLRLAFDMRRFEITQTFLDMNSLHLSMRIMTIAIRLNEVSMVRWLVERNCCPADEHLELAFELKQVEIAQTFLDMNVLPLSMKMMTIAIRFDEKPMLPRVFAACLLLHHGFDSLLEDVDMRAAWTNALGFIATAPIFKNHIPASIARRSGETANDPEDQMRLAGQTLLGVAALFRHGKAFRVLLERGIDPTCPAICEVRKKTSTVAPMDSMSKLEPWHQQHKRDGSKMSDELRQAPLAWAAYTGDLPLVQSSLDRGLDPYIKNRKGQTAVYFAVQQTEYTYPRRDLETDKVGVVRLLQDKGALVTSADAYGGATLLAYAFKARYSRVAKLLLEIGVSIPIGVTTGPMGRVWAAFDQGRDGMRQALLQRIRGAQVDTLPQSAVLDSRWSGDSSGVAAQLAWGGTMRLLGDAVLEACGDANGST